MREPSALTTALTVGPDGVTVDRTRLHEVFYADTDPSVAEGLAARLRPMPLGDPVVMTGTPAWKAVPSTYVVCTRDNALSPATQRFLAARAGQVVEWDTDHRSCGVETPAFRLVRKRRFPLPRVGITMMAPSGSIQTCVRHTNAGPTRPPNKRAC
jgi:hypothetical protein